LLLLQLSVTLYSRFMLKHEMSTWSWWIHFEVSQR